MTSYQELRQTLSDLEVPEIENLNVAWPIPQKLAMGRNGKGEYILLLCSELEIESEIISDAILTDQAWRQEDDNIVFGSMLIFPNENAFLTATASIVIEILRINVEDKEFTDVFSETESYIELILK